MSGAIPADATEAQPADLFKYLSLEKARIVLGSGLLTGLILGCRTPAADRAALTDLARRLNPDVEVLVARPATHHSRIDLEPFEETADAVGAEATHVRD